MRFTGCANLIKPISAMNNPSMIGVKTRQNMRKWRAIALVKNTNHDAFNKRWIG